MDFLLGRYKDIDYVLNSDMDDFLELITTANKKEIEQKAWEMWLVQLPYMDKNSSVSFEEFLNKINGGKTSEEINGVYIDQIGL